MLESWIILLNCSSTLFMTGLIWIIQMVHYPLMVFVDSARFGEFEDEHCRRIGGIVAPVMIVEGLAAGGLLMVTGGSRWWIAIVGFFCVVVIWWSTLTIQVPLHDALGRSYSEACVRRLVLSNWVRTIAWSIRAALAVFLVWLIVP